jgi:hypothetical protein
MTECGGNDSVVEMTECCGNDRVWWKWQCGGNDIAYKTAKNILMTQLYMLNYFEYIEHTIQNLKKQRLQSIF